MLTFGADPECFLTEARHVIPAVGLVGGTKEKPLMVNGFGLQEDNVMAEFTIPVSNSPSDMVMYAAQGVNTLVCHVRDTTKRRVGVSSSPVAEFTHDVLAAAGQQALQFGCSPDYDAYRFGAAHERIHPDILNTSKGALRFAGGHVHIGYKHDVEVPEHIVAMLCDLTIGATLVYHGEKQAQRRTLYGMPGRYRPTPYGIEYRTPSNAWLRSDNLQRGLIVGCNSLIRIMRAGDEVMVRLYNEVPWNDLKQAIMEENDITIQEIYGWLDRSYPNLNLSGDMR